jgi:hypothetical protein
MNSRCRPYLQVRGEPSESGRRVEADRAFLVTRRVLQLAARAERGEWRVDLSQRQVRGPFHHLRGAPKPERRRLSRTRLRTSGRRRRRMTGHRCWGRSGGWWSPEKSARDGDVSPPVPLSHDVVSRSRCHRANAP